MAKRFEAMSKQEAWAIVDSIFPTDYSEDAASRERAGYPIYRSNVEYYDYICDLGDRLEINLKSGKTINVWIVEAQDETLPEMPTADEVKEAAANQYTFEPETVQLVRVFAEGYNFVSEASQSVYKKMKNADEFWRNRIASDMVVAYCEDKGIEWGSIQVIRVTDYENENGGHYVIEAIVKARVKG